MNGNITARQTMTITGKSIVTARKSLKNLKAED